MLSLFLCLLILCLGLHLRLPHLTGPLIGLEQKSVATLNTRTMHGDEAVNTIKFQKLHFPKGEKAGSFVYDPEEYHGPSLYYLTIPFAKLLGYDNFKGTEESLYRGVPLFFGLLMIPLSFLLRNEIGLLGCSVIALFTVVSPGLTYYSRYYIHETLLASFTFAAIVFGFKWYRSRGKMKHIWAVCTGVSLAMMHATKETCIISFAAIFGAIICIKMMQRFTCETDETIQDAANKNRVNMLNVGLFLGGGILTWLLFFSSFFTNMKGLSDSFMTYLHYFQKADAADHGHTQPFWFYHEKLWGSTYGKMVWSEKAILIGAMAGFLLAFLPRCLPKAYRTFGRFVAIYSLLISLAYCTISYKTTWTMLSFLHSYILLCGVGAVSTLHITRQLLAKINKSSIGYQYQLVRGACYLLITIVIGVVTYDLYRTSARTISKRLENHPKNPYALGQPRGDVKKLAKRADELAGLLPAYKQLLVYTHLAPTRYSQLPWPLPWYLRKHQVYYQHIPFGQKDLPEPDMYITDHGYAKTISAKASKNYITEKYGIYPFLEKDKDKHGLVKVYIRMALWEAYLKSQE